MDITNEMLDNNWYAMSDERILKQIGEFVKYHRMEQNKTQTMLAKDAGISRSTLSLLERGGTVTVATLIRVLRVLEKLYIINDFQVSTQLSPLLLAQAEQKGRRQRVAFPRKKDEDMPEDDFIW